MIKTDKLEKQYTLGLRRLTALEQTSFSLSQGQCLLVSGASGSGKTTLLNLVGCQAKPTSGQIWLGEQEITRLPERFLEGVRRWKIGFIFQQFNLLAGFSVLENVTLPLVPMGISLRERRQRGLGMLAQFGLQDRADSPVTELSGGEQQRVAIARALVNGPPLILADEPTSNIDANNGAIVLQTLLKLKQQGKTLIISSHDPLVLKSDLADTVLNLNSFRVSGCHSRANGNPGK